jgi:hypothetical protein
MVTGRQGCGGVFKPTGDANWLASHSTITARFGRRRPPPPFSETVPTSDSRSLLGVDRQPRRQRCRPMPGGYCRHRPHGGVRSWRIGEPSMEGA